MTMSPIKVTLLVALLALIVSVNAQGHLRMPLPITGDRELSVFGENIDVCGVKKDEAGVLYTYGRQNPYTVIPGELKSLQYQVSTYYGGGPLSVYLDPYGTGSSFPSKIETTANILGNDGIAMSTPTGNFPFMANFTIKVPETIQCLGEGSLCLMLVFNGQGVGSCVFLTVGSKMSPYGGDYYGQPSPYGVPYGQPMQQQQQQQVPNYGNQYAMPSNYAASGVSGVPANYYNGNMQGNNKINSVNPYAGGQQYSKGNQNANGMNGQMYYQNQYQNQYQYQYQNDYPSAAYETPYFNGQYENQVSQYRSQNNRRSSSARQRGNAGSSSSSSISKRYQQRPTQAAQDYYDYSSQEPQYYQDTSAYSSNYYY